MKVVAPSSGPQYSMADVCAASTLLNRGGQTFLDAVGIIPVENTIIKGVQFGAALFSAGFNIFQNSAPTDALFAGATLGITTVDNAKVMTTGAEMVPVAGTLISAGATLNDLYGKNGMANYYNDCMAGKN